MVGKLGYYENLRGTWEVDQPDLEKNLNVATNLLTEIFNSTSEHSLSGVSLYSKLINHARVKLGIERYNSYATNPVAVKWFYTLNPLIILDYLKNFESLTKDTAIKVTTEILNNNPPVKRIP